MSNKDANVSLSAAITMDGVASLWAKRMNMLAVETARIAIDMAAGRTKRVRSSVIVLQVYCRRRCTVNE